MPRVPFPLPAPELLARQIARLKRINPETKMLKAIGDYLESQGWLCLVAGANRIQQPAGASKYQFELVISFTGGKLDPPEGAGRALPANGPST